MPVCNRLRLDPGNGFPVVDYRIENGCVETRTLEPGAGSSIVERQWQQVTPEELTSQVMKDTLLARWLSRRMGVFQLICACQVVKGH
jgi:hypothetical protein